MPVVNQSQPGLTTPGGSNGGVGGFSPTSFGFGTASPGSPSGPSMNYGPGTNADAQDWLKWLTQTTTNNAFNPPSPTPIDPRITSTIGGFLDRANTGTGLSPEALTALRQEKEYGLQSRYDTAASNLRTDLLRRGMGGGLLPANGGEILRGFGPLESDFAQATSKAGRDTVLADEQAKQQSLLANNNNALQAIGLGSSIWGQQNQQSLQSYQATLSALDRAIAAANAEGDQERASTGNLIKASLIGAGTKLLTDPKALKAVISTVGSVFGLGGGAAAAGAATASVAGPATATGLLSSGVLGGAATAPTLAAPALATGATAAAPATGVTGALGLGGGSGLFGLGAATIPIVGGAVVGGILLARHFIGEGRKAADVLTKEGGMQKAFEQTLAEIDKMPNLSPEQRWNEKASAYNKLVEFGMQHAQKGKNEKKVVTQMFNTISPLFGQQNPMLMQGVGGANA